LPADVASDFNVQLAWIEYTNRMVGVIIGFLIIGTAWYAFRHHRDNKRIFYPALASLLLVLFQGWLGGQVVAAELAPWLVTAHMILALVIVSLLLYATVGGFYPESQPLTDLPRPRRRVAVLAMIVLLLTLIQVGLGAKLRGDLEHIQEDHPDMARSALIDEAGWSDAVHRSYSWVILGGVIGLAGYIHRRLAAYRQLIYLARGAMVMVIVQVVAGIGLAYAGLPPALQVIHLINASILVGVLTLIYLLAVRLPVGDTAAADRPASHNRLSQKPVLH
jgi:cytochrome c oxidase assembly protein subunit 15